MKAIAINGSPRKSWNTATLLKKALEGAAATGAETESIHLYDYHFQGCCSCFSCKRKNSSQTGCCVIKDDLMGVLQKVLSCDVLLLGSPIYLGDITGMMKSFLERLLFANLSYEAGRRSNFTGSIQTGFIYTMGLPHKLVESFGYPYIFNTNQKYLQLLNGHSEYMLSADAYQFDDYSAYAASNFDENHKAAVRATQFPADCQNAFEMGKRLCMQSANQRGKGDQRK